MSLNWRTQPLERFAPVVQDIAHTTTGRGLTIKALLDDRTYETGRKASKADLAKVNIERNAFQGNWNYVIKPSPPTAERA